MLTEHRWLADHLQDSNLVVIDARGSIPYAYGHIPNSVPLGMEKVIKIANNGANEVIDAPVAEQLFGSLGVDDNKSNCLWRNDGSVGSKSSMDIALLWA